MGMRIQSNSLKMLTPLSETDVNLICGNIHFVYDEPCLFKMDAIGQRNLFQGA